MPAGNLPGNPKAGRLTTAIKLWDFHSIPGRCNSSTGGLACLFAAC
jgi:hypothetical protein